MNAQNEIAVALAADLSNFDSDCAFVEHVRRKERADPWLRNMILWRDEVRKELDFRLLLRKT